MGLDIIEIMMKVEETFGVSIEDGEVEKMSTPRDLIDLVMSKVGQTGPAPSAPGKCTRDQVAARVRDIVVEHLHCTQTYREDASLVKDLGLG